METELQTVFGRYEDFFNRALQGDTNLDELGALYSSEFIGAAPAGVRTAKNDEQFRQAMAQGYDHYRATGVKEMRIRSLDFTAIDKVHYLARATWRATYTQKDRPDLTLDFDVHYLLQVLDQQPKIFGWITGDEQALLKQHGIL